MATKIPPHNKAKLKLFKIDIWLSPELAGGIVILILVVLTQLWRLSALTMNRLSVSELSTKHNLYINSPWWKSTAAIYGPYYTLLHATFAINHSLLAFRLASVIAGLLSTLLVYWLITQWHGYRIALLGSLTYLSSFGFLVLSRQASPISTELLMPLALLFAITIINKKKHLYSLLALIVIAAGSLYIPAAIWLIIAMVILAYPDIKEVYLNQNSKTKLGLIVFNLILIFPLVFSLIRHFSIHRLVTWLGYGLNGRLSALISFARNISYSFLDLFIRSTNLKPTLSLGHLPLLPVIESLIIVIGIIFYFRHLANKRWRNWLILVILTFIISGFGVLSVFTLLPLMAFAFATGLAYTLREWYAVFPINPFARYTGLALMSLVVLFNCYYSARSYYVAWSYDPATTTQYHYRLH